MDPEPAVEYQGLECGSLIGRELTHRSGLNRPSGFNRFNRLGPGGARAFDWATAARLLRPISLRATQQSWNRREGQFAEPNLVVARCELNQLKPLGRQRVKVQ